MLVFPVPNLLKVLLPATHTSPFEHVSKVYTLDSLHISTSITSLIPEIPEVPVNCLNVVTLLVFPVPKLPL